MAVNHGTSTFDRWCTGLVQLGPAVVTTIERWLTHTMTTIDRSHCIVRVYVYVVVCVCVLSVCAPRVLCVCVCTETVELRVCVCTESTVCVCVCIECVYY